MFARLVFVTYLAAIVVAASTLLVCLEPGHLGAPGNVGGTFGIQVVVGGIQFERNDAGRIAVRLRDIVVRDRNGNAVATVPEADG